jgi:hypothetical protein
LQIFLKEAIFLFKKMIGIRKMPTEKEMIAQLRRGEVELPPLVFRSLEDQPDIIGNRRLDALVEASWGNSTVWFAVECKALSTPKVFRDGLNLLKTSALPKNYRPLLFLPYLSERQLQELEREEISGIDLCGNGVVVVPGKFAVFRSGNRNRFPSSAPIKNIYRKNSSMVGRVFLIRSNYGTVQEILEEINRRNLLIRRWDSKPMSFPTVSKSLKTLEGDLIVERNKFIRLLQPDNLLEKLHENYAPPYTRERVRLKVPGSDGAPQQVVQQQAQMLGLPVVATGASSVLRYAVMERGDMLSIYCPRINVLLERLPGSQTDRVPNLELLETDDETVYFDARQEMDFWWASPVQVYLELMAGDKRDQETAGQVKSYILNRLQKMQP